MLLQDARDYQLLFLSLFLILGIGTRDWSLRPDFILVVIVSCLVSQWLAAFLAYLFERLKNAANFPDSLSDLFVSDGGFSFDWLSLKSAGITSLSLCLLLRADSYLTMILAGCLAIFSKFLFQYQGKHFFNPANFGIVCCLLLTGDAWVSPGQWGEDWFYILLFAGTGTMVLKKVGRWDTTAAFLGCYSALEAVRNVWLGWTWDVFFHRLMSGSLLLFALFMITDPRSIPNSRMGRFFWAASIAVLTFILRNLFFIPSAVFWALFCLAPLTVLFDFVWSESVFFWNSKDANNAHVS